MDSRCTPSRIGQAHFADQIDDLARYRGAAQPMAALPSPVRTEYFPVPGDHSFRVDDHQCGSPAAPTTREAKPQQAIGGPQTAAMTTTGSSENQELMPQGKNLSLQRCAGSKSLP